MALPLGHCGNYDLHPSHACAVTGETLLRRSLQDFEAKSKRGDGMGGRKEVHNAPDGLKRRPDLPFVRFCPACRDACALGLQRTTATDQCHLRNCDSTHRGYVQTQMPFFQEIDGLATLNCTSALRQTTTARGASTAA